eukprot:c24739_g1_i2 orf=1223-1741(+)
MNLFMISLLKRLKNMKSCARRQHMLFMYSVIPGKNFNFYRARPRPILQADEEKLRALEKELDRACSDLQTAKTEHARMQSKRTAMQNIINVREPSLLDDMDVSREEAEASVEKLKELKQQYDTLVKNMRNLQKVINQGSTCTEASPKCQGSYNSSLRWGMRRKFLGRQVAAS